MKIEKISNLIYSLGAAIVIFGAWAKIIHKPYADLMLTVGLLTEATLFVYMGASDWLKKSPPMQTISDAVSMDKYLKAPEANNASSAELTKAIEKLNDNLSRIFRTN